MNNIHRRIREHRKPELQSVMMQYNIETSAKTRKTETLIAKEGTSVSCYTDENIPDKIVLMMMGDMAGGISIVLTSEEALTLVDRLTQVAWEKMEEDANDE